MDYEKLHKDTINKLQEMVNSGKITVETARGICADFVLESEDEKIRKKLIKLVKMSSEVGGFALHKWEADKMLAWLEKQSEQKPAAWSEEDEDYYNAIIAKLEVTQEDAALTDNQMQFLKSLKDRVQPQPKQEWSEEDEEMIQDIINDIAIAQEQVYCKSRCEEEIDWLKSIHPQKQWKPSEEQIKVCKEVYADILSAKCFDLGTVNDELNRLEVELKKLKG